MASPFTNVIVKDITVNHVNSLRHLINTCESSMFVQHCLPWYTYLVPVLQRNSISLNIKEAVCCCLIDLLGYASSNSYIARELATRHLSSLIETLTISPQLLYATRTAFDLLNTLAHLFPGTAGQFGGKIEKRILASVDTEVASDILEAASNCFARLPSAGKQAKREERCLEFQEKLFGSLSDFGRDISKLMEASSELDDFNTDKRFGFTKIKIQPESIPILSRRIHFLIDCYEAFLSQATLCAVPICVTTHLTFFVGFLSINCIKLRKSAVTEINQSARFALTVQTHMWSALRLLFDVLKNAMALHSAVVINLFCQHLDWTKVNKDSNQRDPILTKHRTVVYQFLVGFLRHVGLLALVPLYLNRLKIVGYLLEDIKPVPRPDAHSARQVSAVSDPVVGGPVNKKVKKRRNQKQNRMFVTMGDGVFTQDFKINMDSCKAIVIEAWRVLAVFWSQLANFIGVDPFSHSENGGYYHNNSVLVKIQWTVEKILSELIAKPGETIIPYGDPEVLLSLTEFLDVFYLPRQQSSSPVMMSLVSSFLSNLVNHRDSSVQISASRGLVRLDACVTAWTPTLTGTDIVTTSRQETITMAEVDCIDDETSDMEEDVEMETLINHTSLIPKTTSLSSTENTSILMSTSVISEDNLIQQTTPTTPSRNSISSHASTIVASITKPSNDEETPTKRLKLCSPSSNKPISSENIKTINNDVNISRNISELDDLTKLTDNNTNKNDLVILSPSNKDSRHTSTEDSHSKKDVDYVSVEDMLASFVDTS